MNRGSFYIPGSVKMRAKKQLFDQRSVIAAIPGCDSLLMLRRVHGTADNYRIVGPAKVPGLMHGIIPERLQPQQITIV